MKRILVALDDPSINTVIFDQALTIARAISAQLMVLHVGYEDEDRKRQQQWKADQIQWEACLRSYINQAEAAGIKAESTLSYGNPGYVICDWAWTWDADLIVLGRHGQTHVPGWMSGSVSTYVSQHAPCSVMLVSPQRKLDSAQSPDRKIAVEGVS
jgi:nucleotide-binding universal stress UspA family protein